jgi:hypothetical protein
MKCAEYLTDGLSAVQERLCSIVSVKILLINSIPHHKKLIHCIISSTRDAEAFSYRSASSEGVQSILVSTMVTVKEKRAYWDHVKNCLT